MRPVWNASRSISGGASPALLRFAAQPGLSGPDKILSIAELKQKVVAAGSPYIKGTWVKRLSGRETSLLRTLDRLAEKLSQIDFPAAQVLGHSFKPGRLPEFRVRSGNEVMSVAHVGSGTFGSVFRVTVNEEKMAFKTFYPRHRELYYSGPWSETAMGLYATQKQVSDMPHLIAANPGKNWLLSEFVEGDFRSSTPNGPRWKDLGLNALDADVQENDVRTSSGPLVHLDYGAITGPQRAEETLHQRPQEVFGFPLGSPPMLSLERFKRELKAATPERRISVIEHLGLLPSADRLVALKTGLAYPELKHFPVAMFVGARVITSAQVAKLAPWLAKQKSQSFRTLAAFVTHQTTRQALPLRIAEGQAGAIKDWLADVPGLLA